MSPLNKIAGIRHINSIDYTSKGIQCIDWGLAFDISGHFTINAGFINERIIGELIKEELNVRTIS